METQKFKPLSNNVLVRILKDTMTTGGLFLPSAYEEGKGAMKCLVEAVGPGTLKPDGSRAEMPAIKPGDVILIFRLGSAGVARKRVCDSYLDADWENLISIASSEILAIIETESIEEG